ncbi:MAG: FAD-binding oxidoreductase [Bacteroidota bacterium]
MGQPKKNSVIDVIIVGQGIAGSVMALTLIKSGYTVCVIDQPDLSSSSKIAAGIWNPIVFKRLTKSWLADELVPELINFYEYWQTQLQTTFIHHRTIIKPFTEEQEKSLWLKKAAEGNVFLDNNLYENLQIDKNNIAASYSKVLQAGNLEVAHFLNCTKTYIKETQTYLEETFDHTQLKISEEEISYKNITAKHLIFCEGHLISKNPYFSWIPMKPAKGEILTIRCEGLQLNHDIFNKGFFILPLGDNVYKVGATYEWENLNDLPTEKAKQELLQKLNAVITVPYSVVAHQAGVRPAVIDRRPVVGSHPQHKNMFVFNGFGTKAVMLAPFFAKQLLANIQQALAVDSEVDSLRFFK